MIDVDARHGDGAQQIFYGHRDVLTVSIHTDPNDYYPLFAGYPGETGHGEGDGFNLNLPLQHGGTGDDMAAAAAAASDRVRAFAADALVVALGYDAHRDDPIGVLKLETADFGAVGRQLRALDLPTLVVQQGGYATEVIGKCLDAFLAGPEDAWRA